MALIPAGSFAMGDTLDGESDALPVHTIYVSAFYMDKYDVTLALWQ
jgi:formylglycine-generating enzyme required for sulfatase activity